MKARFTDEQIIAMIKKQEDGEKTADVCRRARSHSDATAEICRLRGWIACLHTQASRVLPESAGEGFRVYSFSMTLCLSLALFVLAQQSHNDKKLLRLSRVL